MRRNQHLRMVIAVDGTCRIDAVNFAGSACQVATLELAAVLGGGVLSQRSKPETWLRERALPNQQEEAR